MSELLSQVLSIGENITETKSSQVKSNEIFVFVEGKTGTPKENLSQQSRQQTNSTHI